MLDKREIVATGTRESEDVSGGAKSNKIRIPIIAAAAVIVLVLCGLVYAEYGYGKIYPNVYINELDLGTMTEAQAKELIQDKYSEIYKDKSLKLSILDESYVLIPEDLNASVDIEKTARSAMRYGREGGFFKRAGAIIGLIFKYGDAEIKYNIDENKIRELSADMAKKARSVKKEYTYIVTDTHIVVDNASVGVNVKSEELSNEIISRIKSFDFSDFSYIPELDEPKPLDLEELHTRVETLPVNAYFDKDVKEIVPEKPGITFNISEAQKALLNMSEKIYIPLIKTMPDITGEMLDNRLFKDTLAEYKTYLNPGNINRTNNVRLATKSINNTILNPGEEFSYNKIVGQRTEARGFKDAFVYINGEVVEDIGGGICQVSSTIYAAVLHANLKVVERQNHSFSVTYVPLGLDATVYWGSLDFRFLNDTGYPIKIIAVQKDNYVYIQILGTKENDHFVEMKTKTLSYIPYGTNTVEDPTLPYGTQKVTIEGHSASVVEAYKIIYDGAGNIISNKLESRNSYKLLNQTVVVGTNGSPDASETTPELPPEDSPVYPTEEPENPADLPHTGEEPAPSQPQEEQPPAEEATAPPVETAPPPAAATVEPIITALSN